MGNVRKTASSRRRSRRAASPFRTNAVPVKAKPPRGVKLKTVSRLTLLLALLCLGAFLAGRPPETGSGATGSAPATAVQGRTATSARIVITER